LSFILLTWPYHLSWDLSTYYCIGCTPTMSRIILFLILSLLVLPSIFLKNRISQACIALCLFEFTTHDSQEYVRIGMYWILLKWPINKVCVTCWVHFKVGMVMVMVMVTSAYLQVNTKTSLVKGS
jgi:NhaP-type Na+/H+ and K+/H+ antiporter